MDTPQRKSLTSVRNVEADYREKYVIYRKQQEKDVSKILVLYKGNFQEFGYRAAVLNPLVAGKELIRYGEYVLFYDPDETDPALMICKGDADGSGRSVFLDILNGTIVFCGLKGQNTCGLKKEEIKRIKKDLEERTLYENAMVRMLKVK